MAPSDIRKGTVVVLRGTDWPVYEVTSVQRAKTVTHGNMYQQFESRVPMHVRVREINGASRSYLLSEIDIASDESVVRWNDHQRSVVARFDSQIDAGETLVGWTPSMMLGSRNLLAKRIGIPERTER